MMYLYEVKSSEDFDEYYKIKMDDTAILWSGFASAPDRERLKAHFEMLICNENVFLYYLRNSETGEVVGYDQMVRIDIDTVESAGHSIKSQYQGKGLGNLLFRLLIEQAVKLNFKRFTGWVSENNIGSIKNLENNGFIRTDTPYRIVKLEALAREDKFYCWERIL